MLTLAWYNIVALLVGFLFVVWFYSLYKEERIGALFKWVGFVRGVLGIVFIAIFYLLWGGIFWW